MSAELHFDDVAGTSLRAQQELAVLRAERDSLRMFAQGFAEAACYYGDECSVQVIEMRRHGRRVNCQARAALALDATLIEAEKIGAPSSEIHTRINGS